MEAISISHTSQCIFLASHGWYCHLWLKQGISVFSLIHQMSLCPACGISSLLSLMSMRWSHKVWLMDQPCSSWQAANFLPTQGLKATAALNDLPLSRLEYRKVKLLKIHSNSPDLHSEKNFIYSWSGYGQNAPRVCQTWSTAPDSGKLHPEFTTYHVIIYNQDGSRRQR